MTFLVAVASDLNPAEFERRDIAVFPTVRGVYVVDAEDAEDAAAQVEELKEVHPGVSLVVSEAAEFIVRTTVEPI